MTTLPCVTSFLSSTILWSNSPSDSTLPGHLKLAASVKTLISFWFCLTSATRSSTSWTRWFIISTRTKAAVQINKDTNDTGQTSLDEHLWKSRAGECSCFSAMTKTLASHDDTALLVVLCEDTRTKTCLKCDSCVYTYSKPGHSNSGCFKRSQWWTKVKRHPERKIFVVLLKSSVVFISLDIDYLYLISSDPILVICTR